MRCKDRINENADIIRKRLSNRGNQPAKTVNLSLSTGIGINNNINSQHFSKGSPMSTQSKEQELYSQAKKMLKQNTTSSAAAGVHVRATQLSVPSKESDYQYSHHNIVRSRKVNESYDRNRSSRGSPHRNLAYLFPKLNQVKNASPASRNDDLVQPNYYHPQPNTCSNKSAPRNTWDHPSQDRSDDYISQQKFQPKPMYPSPMRGGDDSVHSNKQIWTDGTQTAVLATSNDIFTHSPARMAKQYQNRPRTRENTAPRQVLWTVN